MRKRLDEIVFADLLNAAKQLYTYLPPNINKREGAGNNVMAILFAVDSSAVSNWRTQKVEPRRTLTSVAVAAAWTAFWKGAWESDYWRDAWKQENPTQGVNRLFEWLEKAGFSRDDLYTLLSEVSTALENEPDESVVSGVDLLWAELGNELEALSKPEKDTEETALRKILQANRCLLPERISVESAVSLATVVKTRDDVKSYRVVKILADKALNNTRNKSAPLGAVEAFEVSDPATGPAVAEITSLPVSALATTEVRVAEGAVIKEKHPSFPTRKDHSKDLFAEWFHRIYLPDGPDLLVPYKELFGSSMAGVKEYREGQNITISYNDKHCEYSPRVEVLSFDSEKEKNRLKLAAMGYKEHPDKLWLVRYQEERPDHVEDSVLHLTFGASSYLDNLVWRGELQKSKKEQEFFGKVIASGTKEHLQGFDYGPWAQAGGGCFVVTADNMLVLSYRVRVGEVPSVLGYSASGSFGRKAEDGGNNTPGKAMVKELREELGLYNVRPTDLTQISLGLDLGRGLIQFSYLLDVKETSRDILQMRGNRATTVDEQINFFVSLADGPGNCYRLLREVEFEPGAAFGLYRFLTKRFGEK